MKMLKGNSSITQLRAVGELPPKADLFDWAATNLKTWRFTPIHETSDEASIGWVHAGSTDDTDFEMPRHFYYGDYLCFTLRNDQRKIHHKLLKTEVRKAEKAYMRKNPASKLTKGLREQILQEVKTRLLKKTLPTPSTIDVLWNLTTGIVTIGSLGQKNLDRFCGIANRTFQGVVITPLSPFERASIVVPAELKAELEKSNISGSASYPELVKNNKWLGTGFFMWLFHRTTEGHTGFTGQFGRIADAHFNAYIDKKIILVGQGEDDVQTVILTGKQDRFTELRSALQAGKTITEGTIVFEKGELAWQMTLKGDTFQFNRLKFPKTYLSKKDKDLDEASQGYETFVLIAASHLEDGQALFDSLFQAFLAERLGPIWEHTKVEIQKAIEGTEH